MPSVVGMSPSPFERWTFVRSPIGRARRWQGTPRQARRARLRARMHNHGGSEATMPFVVRKPRSAQDRARSGGRRRRRAVGREPAPASAATTPTVCVTPSFSQIFLPWKDTALYTKSPGGDFEGTLPGWTLGRRRTRRAPGTSRSTSAAPTDQRVAVAGAGASAVSSSMCIDRTYPSFRFFARNLSAGMGDLQVEVVWQESGVRRTSKAAWTRRPARRGRPVKSLRLPTGALSTGASSPSPSASPPVAAPGRSTISTSIRSCGAKNAATARERPPSHDGGR